MLTQEEIKEIWEYRDGHLYWLVKPCLRTYIGDRAGRVNSQVGYQKKYYMISQLIWIYHYGNIPEGYIIDHEDTNKLNNEVENYRLVTNQQNRGQYLKGVTFDSRRIKKPWRSDIMLEAKKQFIGYYKTEIEAHEAWCEFAEILHGEFFNSG